MTDETERIPFNKVGNKPVESVAEVAQSEGISEAEWRAQNLPTEKLEFRWRYTNKTIHLYERRLRSLAAFNVGPAVQAWVRSRLEWVRDNRFYEMPEGVIVLTIDPEGVVDIQQEEARALPAGEDAPGSHWFATDDALYTQATINHAADTLVRDLAKTLRYELVAGEAPEGAEEFVVSDEFGIVAQPDNTNEAIVKLIECFDKLWTLDK